MGPGEGRAERDNPLPFPAGHLSQDAAQDTAGLPGCKRTLLAHACFMHTLCRRAGPQPRTHYPRGESGAGGEGRPPGLAHFFRSKREILFPTGLMRQLPSRVKLRFPRRYTVPSRPENCEERRGTIRGEGERQGPRSGTHSPGRRTSWRHAERVDRTPPARPATQRGSTAHAPERGRLRAEGGKR